MDPSTMDRRQFIRVGDHYYANKAPGTILLGTAVGLQLLGLFAIKKITTVKV